MKKLLSLLLAALLLALPVLALGEAEDALKAACEEAEALYDAGSYAEALLALEALAETDYARAINMIGVGYAEGHFSADGQPDYATALEWYLKAAELEYPASMYNIAMRYYRGQVTADGQPDYAAAYAWFVRATEYHHAHAFGVLGDGCREGYFTENGEPDLAAAYDWYVKGTENGDEYSMHDIAEGYRDGWWNDAPDYQKALEWYIRSDEAGMTCAAEHAAEMLLTGRTAEDGTVLLEKDYVRAFPLLEAAYAKGRENAYVLSWLGWFYAGNAPEAVEGDYVRAIEAYTRGAEKGDGYCMYMLGMLYLEDRVGENDYATAAEWLGKAAETGRLDAAEKLAELYTNGRKTEDSTVLFAADYARALPALEKACELGTQIKSVFDYLGWIYAGNTDAMEADYPKALEVYTRGAELGSGYCMEQLGLLYRDGRLGDPDAAKAIEWFEAALAIGYEAAQGRLNEMAE